MRHGICLLAIVTSLTAVACGEGKPQIAAPPSVTPPPREPATATPSARPAPPAPAWPPGHPPQCEQRGWGTSRCGRPRAADAANRGPSTITAVKVSKHDGYDRVTFSFSDPLPGLELQFIREVLTYESGKKVNMPDSAYLLGIDMSFAASIKDDDQRTKLRPNPYPYVVAGFPALAAYSMNGDHHGAVHFTLGLTSRAAFRVRTSGAALTVDVRHPSG